MHIMYRYLWYIIHKIFRYLFDLTCMKCAGACIHVFVFYNKERNRMLIISNIIDYFILFSLETGVSHHRTERKAIFYREGERGIPNSERGGPEGKTTGRKPTAF